MKNLKTSLAALILVLITFSSCEKSEPDIPVSDRDKFLGNWDAESFGPNGNRDFILSITASASAPDQIRMQSFDGGAGSVFATVSGTNLSIITTVISGETISGTGNFANNTLSFTYTIDDGQTVENRTCTAIKS